MTEFQEYTCREIEKRKAPQGRIIDEVTEEFFVEREKLDYCEFHPLRRFGVKVVENTAGNKDHVVGLKTKRAFSCLNGAATGFHQTQLTLDVAVGIHPPPGRIRGFNDHRVFGNLAFVVEYRLSFESTHIFIIPYELFLF